MSTSSMLSSKTYQKVLNRESFGPDSVIFKEGDHGNKAYVITRGKVDIVTKTVDGKYKKLRELKEGELFGEMSLLNGDRRSAHALTKEGCEVLIISQAVLKEKLEAADPFLKFWIEFLSERMLDVSKRVK
ncbi:MAG: cyclic nucleotide-binding domain-containing protein [Rhodospirillaceae bacterium]